MSIDLSNIKEDRDVVEPFVERLLARLNEKFPGRTFTRENITLRIEFDDDNGPVIDGAASTRIRRMIHEMDKEGVVL